MRTTEALARIREICIETDKLIRSSWPRVPFDANSDKGRLVERLENERSDLASLVSRRAALIGGEQEQTLLASLGEAYGG